jgi:D-lyxose ketol-isomerase
MKTSEVIRWREKACQMLEKAHIVMTPEEKQNMEIADCGFNDIETLGLHIVVYENNQRYCAKELILFPQQFFPEHFHPRIDEHNEGKQETFRCRWGEVYLYVEGDPSPNPKARVPEDYKRYLTVWKEVILKPGDQYTLHPNTKHWFQAGQEGCIVSEFSSTSIDETDVFTDPRVKRMPVIEED